MGYVVLEIGDDDNDDDAVQRAKGESGRGRNEEEGQAPWLAACLPPGLFQSATYCLALPCLPLLSERELKCASSLLPSLVLFPENSFLTPPPPTFPSQGVTHDS